MIKKYLKRKWPYLLLIFVGLLLLFMAISKLSGEFLIILSVIGGFVVLMGFWKSVKKEAVENALVKDKYDSLIEEHSDLKKAHQKLQKAHQHIHDMKINVSNIKPLIEIGMFEAETSYTRFVDQYFDQFYNEINDDGMIQLIQNNPSAYVEKYNDTPIRISGALHFNIDAIYGVKVDEIQVKLYEENGLPKVDVYGAKPQFLSFKSREVKWRNPIALQYNAPLIGKESWKTDNKIQLQFSRYIDDCKDQVIKESERGPAELNWIKKPLENQIKSMLNILFFKGYVIDFVSEIDDNFMSLNEFANSKLIESSNWELLSNYAQKEISESSDDSVSN